MTCGYWRGLLVSIGVITVPFESALDAVRPSLVERGLAGFESKKLVPWNFQNTCLAQAHLHDAFVPAFIICQHKRCRARFMSSAIHRTFDNMTAPNNRVERRATFGWVEAVWRIQCWHLLSLRMAERNLPFSGEVCHLVIEAAKVLDSNFVPFLWLLIALTMLHDLSRKTHCEPGTGIETKDDLRMIWESSMVMQIFLKEKCQNWWRLCLDD